MIGFTTSTFKKALARGEKGYEDILRWASIEYFDFLELRDSGGELSEQAIHRFSFNALGTGMHPLLAWDCPDPLTREGEMTWKREIEAAAMLPEPRVCRVTIAPQRVGSAGWYDEDLAARVAEKIADIVRLADRDNVVLALENSFESIEGFANMLERIPASKVCLDPTNFLTNAGEPLEDFEAPMRAFVRRFEDRIAYVHLKSSTGCSLDRHLRARGDFDLCVFLESFGTEPWLCIEVPAVETFELACESVSRARETLQEVMK